MKTEIVNADYMLDELISKILQAKPIFHPDTESTYAAYQFVFGKHEIWVNARNGEIIGMGNQINKL